MITGLCNSEMLQLFEVGMRVKVSDHQYSYLSKRNMNKVNGAYGTVSHIDTHYEKIVVELDAAVNDLSATGHFFFKPRELIILDKNDNIMEDKTMVISNIKNYLNAVRVRISGEAKSTTHLYANFEPDIKLGDLVVVKQTYGMAVAIVEEILEGDNFTVQREVVTKINTEAFNNRVKIREQAAELKTKMEERARQLQDVVLYKTLAETDPDMKELLNKYLELIK